MNRSRSAMIAVAVLVAAFGSACSNGSPTPSSPSDATNRTVDDAGPGDATTAPRSESTGPAGVVPVGFTTVQAEITATDGEVCEVCLWLADDDDERGRGLMGVTDLGDAVGMAFRFDEPFRGAFYMFDTPTPLSIAWFAPNGGFVGSADMAPCLDTPAGDCPLYGPDEPYDLAIEVFDGGLEPLGLGAASSIRLIDGSETDRCPLGES